MSLFENDRRCSGSDPSQRRRLPAHSQLVRVLQCELEQDTKEPDIPEQRSEGGRWVVRYLELRVA